MLSIKLMFSIMSAKKHATSVNSFAASHAKALNKQIRAYWYNYQCKQVTNNTIIVKSNSSYSYLFVVISNSCTNAASVLRVNENFTRKTLTSFQSIYNFKLTIV